jgi:hypothetical protein
MEKLLLLILTTVDVSAKAQTSVYHPFPDSNAVWIGQTFNATGFFFRTDWNYYLNGDTVSNGNTYTKLYKNYHRIQTDQFFSVVLYDYGLVTGEYAGSIRNDTAQRKVFYLLIDNSGECLLYNFGLQAGDSINTPQYCGMTSAPNAYLYSIDSINLGSNYRKKFNIHNDLPMVFYIEGMGSDHGLLEGMDRFEQWSTLLCFFQNDSLMYGSGCTFLSVEENNSSAVVNFSPNPFHNSCILTISGLHFVTGTLNIYDIKGRSVRKEEINSSSTLINRNSLAEGMYFYQVINDKGQVASGKFIID